MAERARRTGKRSKGAGAPPRSASPLLERDEALTTLAAALDSTAAGRGRLVVIEGEAGTGKSRLLAEAERMADERGFEVHVSRGTALARGHPLGALSRLLDRPLASLDDTDRDALRATAAGPAVDIVAGAGAERPPADVVHALATSFYRLYDHLCERQPILVAVDDLHWVDRGSAEALAYLAARLEDLPIAAVLTIRTGEPLPGPDPRAMAGESEATVELFVRSLGRDASARLLEALLGQVDDAFARAAFEATAGNPFLLRELALTVSRERMEPNADGARAIAATAPDSVRAWAVRRLAPMGEAERALARSLAVLEGAELLVAASHAGLDPEVVRSAADRLAIAGLVDAELPLRFAHPLVRNALYEDIPPAARDDAHHRAAEVLVRREAPAEVVAAHLLACEPRGERWAVEALRTAAAAALARGAAEEAGAALARAASEPGLGDDPGLLVELGRARAALNDVGAIGDLERAARAGGGEVRVGALAALAQARYLAGDIRGAFETAGEALREIEPGTGGLIEAELLLGRLYAGRQSPELVASVRDSLSVERAPEGVPSPAELVRRQVLALDSYLTGQREAATEHARWVAERLLVQPPSRELPSLYAIGPAFVLTGLGEWGAAEELIEQALERARYRGSPLETAECLHERIWNRWRRGDVVGGLGDVETVLELTAGAWDPAKVPMRVARAHLLLERGDLPGAEASLKLEPRLERAVPGTWGWPWLAIGRATVALVRREPDAALEQALAAGERLEEIDAPSPEYVAWRSLAARAALALGERDRAEALALSELEEAERIGAPRARGTALAALADVGPPADRARSLQEATIAFEEAGAELLRARALLALGMELRRARHPSDAREPLRRALDLAHRTGSTAIAERALAELRAAGARPRRQRSSGGAALTPREREIALLAARGLGNVEIAERLFITRKTVEGHLRAVFRKLGIAHREEIARALGR